VALGISLRRGKKEEKATAPGARQERRVRVPRRKIKKTKSFIGIDFLSNQVRITQISKKGKEVKLERVTVGEIPPEIFRLGKVSDVGALAEVLHKIMTDAGITGSYVVLSLSGMNSVVRVITLPKMTRSQLRETMEVQLGQFVPFPPEDTVYQYKILGEVVEEETPMNEILLAAARYSLIHPLVQAVTLLGLQPVAVKVGYVSVLSVLKRYYEDFAQAVAIVDLRDKFCDISFVAENAFQFSRTVEFGQETIYTKIGSLVGLSTKEIRERLREGEIDLMAPVATEVEEGASETTRLVEGLKNAFQSFANELVRSVRYYEAKSRRKLRVGRIVLVGGVSNFVNLEPFLMETTAVDVVIGDPLENVDYSTAEWFPPEYKANISEIAVSLGLAVDGINPKTRKDLNLLPREFLVRKQVQNVVVGFVAGVALAAGFMYAFRANLLAQLQALQAEQSKWEQKVKSVEPDAKQFDEIQAKITDIAPRIRTIALGFGSQFPWTVLLEEIQNLTPKNVWLGQTVGGASSPEGLILEKLPAIEVKGQAIGLRPIFTFAKAIYDSEIFVGDVMVEYQEATRVGGGGGGGGGPVVGGGGGMTMSVPFSESSPAIAPLGVGSDLGQLLRYFELVRERPILYNFTLKFQMDQDLIQPKALMDKFNELMGIAGGGAGGTGTQGQPGGAAPAGGPPGGFQPRPGGPGPSPGAG